MNIDVSKLTIEELLQIRERLKELDVRVVSRASNQKKASEYGAWDWTKRDSELAAEHGCSTPTVSKWRKILNKPKVKRSKYWPACQQWDWSKSDTELAGQLGISLTIITKYRRKLFKPQVVQAKPAQISPSRIIRPDFSQVNWHQCDTTIARQLRCTREYVRQKRAVLGIPKYLYQDQKYDQFLKAINGAKELSYPQAGKLISISDITFKKYCTRAGIKYMPNRIILKYPWHLMNWQLPNQILKQIWKLPTAQLAASRRNGHGTGKALFKPIGYSVPEQFKELVAAEKAKAEQYFSTQ